MTRDNEEFVNEVVQDQIETRLAISKARAVETPLNNTVVESGKWHAYISRTGLIAKKIGIYPMWSKEGRLTLTTLLQVFILINYKFGYSNILFNCFIHVLDH